MTGPCSRDRWVLHCVEHAQVAVCAPFLAVPCRNLNVHFMSQPYAAMNALYEMFCAYTSACGVLWCRSCLRAAFQLQRLPDPIHNDALCTLYAPQIAALFCFDSICSGYCNVCIASKKLLKVSVLRTGASH